MRNAAAVLLDLVLPTECAGCGSVGSALCGHCKSRACGAPHRRVVLDAIGPLEVWSAVEYEGVSREVVLECKAVGNLELMRIMVRWAEVSLAVWACAHGARDPLVVVPLHAGRATRAASGCDLPVHLCRRAARRLRRRGMNVRIADILTPMRRGPAQKDLGAVARFANARRSFGVSRAGRRLAPTGCVVFDDIATTGATLLAARAALSGYGWSVTGAATVASVGTQAGDAPEGMAGLRR